MCIVNLLSFSSSEIGCLTNLEFLNVTGNELSELPTGLGKLLKLQKLNICNNKLTKLPSCNYYVITQISSLSVIKHNNKL